MGAVIATTGRPILGVMMQIFFIASIRFAKHMTYGLFLHTVCKTYDIWFVLLVVLDHQSPADLIGSGGKKELCDEKYKSLLSMLGHEAIKSC